MIDVTTKSCSPPYETDSSIKPNSSEETRISYLELEKVDLEKILRKIIVAQNFNDGEFFTIKTKSANVDSSAYELGGVVSVPRKAWILIEFSNEVRGHCFSLELISGDKIRFCNFLPLFLDKLETFNAKLKVNN